MLSLTEAALSVLWCDRVERSGLVRASCGDVRHVGCRLRRQLAFRGKNMAWCPTIGLEQVQQPELWAMAKYTCGA